MRRHLCASALGLYAAVAAAGEAPPAQMPTFGRTSFTLPVVLYDANGQVVSGLGGDGSASRGSVTAPGMSGTTAQAVQGTVGGVPVPISGSFLLDTTFTGRINTLGQKTSAQSTPVVLPSDQIVPVIGAPAASSIITVQRTTGIGAIGSLVSAADASNRRTVANIGSIACELMGSAAAYGTGYPLPAGGYFTFDASGRTTAALYVACASAGGAVAVLSY